MGWDKEDWSFEGIMLGEDFELEEEVELCEIGDDFLEFDVELYMLYKNLIFIVIKVI